VKPKLSAREALSLYAIGMAVAFGFFLLGLNWSRITNPEAQSPPAVDSPVSGAPSVSETTTRLDLYTAVAPRQEAQAVSDRRLGESASQAATPVSPFPEPSPGDADVAPAFGEALTIQVGALNTEAEARKLMVRLEARGYTAVLDLPKPGGDKYYRVRLGTYETREAAKRAEVLLKSEGFLTYIKKIDVGGQDR
jgi:cell division septation protein DedD